MIRELQVRELALVETATVGFGPGLNLLTGETGSGKSLIVDALGLTLGARASAEQVRAGSERALAEAVFDLEAAPAAVSALAAIGHPSNGQVILTREVGRRGGARINGRPATAEQLRELGRVLVAIHGQHEQQLLLDVEAQTLMIDAWAGALPTRERVAAAHRAWTAASARLADLERRQARGRREEEYLRWQLDELRAADLRSGEDAELAAERGRVRHAARLSELAEAALEALRSDDGLPAATTGVRAAAELDPGLEPLAGRLAGLEEEVADAAAELRRYAGAIDADPARLEQLEARLALLEQLKRKYGGDLDSAIAERDRLQAQLGAGEDLEVAIAGAAAEAGATRSELERAGADLTRARERAGSRFGAAVGAELHGLRLEGAILEPRLVARTEIGADGAEVIELHFSANPGEPPAPLARVASGGELARVMLAVKTVSAASDAIPTLVFDEVDSGIGGEAAVQVGLRLRALGRHRQVLVVTHLAQIACYADRHLVVEKGPGEGGRNVVGVRRLETPEERAAELARMMSGRVTEKALARAHELLAEAGVA